MDNQSGAWLSARGRLSGVFPIVLDLKALLVVLVGEGEAVETRLALLDAAGAGRIELYSANPSQSLRERAGARLRGARPTPEVIGRAGLLLLAGLAEGEAAPLAAAGRQSGVLVNTEDRKALCDFHLPSVLRRGELLVSVSTGGRVPGLARRLRIYLEGVFGPEWTDRLEEVAARREDWRSEGLDGSEVGRRTDAYVEEKGWLR